MLESTSKDPTPSLTYPKCEWFLFRSR